MAYRDSTSAQNTVGGATSLDLTIPAVQAGDAMLLIISVATASAPTFDALTGWTILYTTQHTRYFYRPADAGDAAGGTYTPTWTGAGRCAGLITAHSGIDTDDPILSFIWWNDYASGATPVNLGIPMAGTADLDLDAIWVNGRGAAVIDSQPSGYTLDESPDSGTNSTGGVQIGLAHLDVSAGSAPEVSWATTTGVLSQAETVHIAWRRTGQAPLAVRSITPAGTDTTATFTLTRPPTLLAADGDLTILLFAGRDTAMLPFGLFDPAVWTQVFAASEAQAGSNGGTTTAFWRWLLNGETSWTFTQTPVSGEAWSSASAVLIAISGAHKGAPIYAAGYQAQTSGSTSYVAPALAMLAPTVPALLLAISHGWGTTVSTWPSGYGAVAFDASPGASDTRIGLAAKSESGANPAACTFVWSTSTGAMGMSQIAIAQGAGMPGHPGALGLKSARKVA